MVLDPRTVAPACGFDLYTKGNPQCPNRARYSIARRDGALTRPNYACGTHVRGYRGDEFYIITELPR